MAWENIPLFLQVSFIIFQKRIIINLLFLLVNTFLLLFFLNIYVNISGSFLVLICFHKTLNFIFSMLILNASMMFALHSNVTFPLSLLPLLFNSFMRFIFFSMAFVNSLTCVIFRGTYFL
jgi:hypothetical protein